MSFFPYKVKRDYQRDHFSPSERNVHSKSGRSNRGKISLVTIVCCGYFYLYYALKICKNPWNQSFHAKKPHEIISEFMKKKKLSWKVWDNFKVSFILFCGYKNSRLFEDLKNQSVSESLKGRVLLLEVRCWIICFL